MPPRSTARAAVTFTELGAETGLWCPTCALPSGVARLLAVRVGRTPAGVSRIARCEECRTPL